MEEYENMTAKKKYVRPPRPEKVKPVASGINHSYHQNAYSYLHPSYWKRKLLHLLLVVPVVWNIYGLILVAIFSSSMQPGIGIAVSLLGGMMNILHLILTVMSAYFYPFSLYWYRQSWIGRFLNSMWYFGGFWAVIGKVIATLIGGILIAGFLAPIAGPMTLRQCRRKNIVIGEAKDFE